MQALYKNKHIKGFYVPYDVMKWCMEQGISKEVELYLSLPHMVRGEAPQGYFEIARHWIEEGMKDEIPNIKSTAFFLLLPYCLLSVIQTPV